MNEESLRRMDDHIPTLIRDTAAQGEKIDRLQIDVGEIKVTMGEVRDCLHIQRGQRKTAYVVVSAVGAVLLAVVGLLNPLKLFGGG